LLLPFFGLLNGDQCDNLAIRVRDQAIENYVEGLFRASRGVDEILYYGVMSHGQIQTGSTKPGAPMLPGIGQRS
jgi:hypothetical protein